MSGYFVLCAPPYQHGTFDTYCDWRVSWWTARHSFGSGPCPVDAWESEGGAVQVEVDPDTIDYADNLIGEEPEMVD